MEFELGQLRGVVTALSTVMGNTDIPIKPSYWIAKIYKKLNGEFEDFEKIRIKLVEKHSAKDKDGKPVVDPETNKYEIPDMEAFEKEFKEIAKEKVTVDIDKIAIDDLGDAKIQPQVLLFLDEIFAMEKEDKVELRAI